MGRLYGRSCGRLAVVHRPAFHRIIQPGLPNALRSTCEHEMHTRAGCDADSNALAEIKTFVVYGWGLVMGGQAMPMLKPIRITDARLNSPANQAAHRGTSKPNKRVQFLAQSTFHNSAALTARQRFEWMTRGRPRSRGSRVGPRRRTRLCRRAGTRVLRGGGWRIFVIVLLRLCRMLLRSR